MQADSNNAHNSRQLAQSAARSRRRRRAIVALALALGACATDPDESTDTSDLTLVSSNGITVTASRWISPRTIEADISTPLVSPSAVNGPHRIRVTLPSFYDQNPTTRFPVVYLLHGGAGGNSAQAACCLSLGPHWDYAGPATRSRRTIPIWWPPWPIRPPPRRSP